jgi:hypothetical protein
MNSWGCGVKYRIANRMMQPGALNMKPRVPRTQRISRILRESRSSGCVTVAKITAKPNAKNYLVSCRQVLLQNLHDLTVNTTVKIHVSVHIWDHLQAVSPNLSLVIELSQSFNNFSNFKIFQNLNLKLFKFSCR